MPYSVEIASEAKENLKGLDKPVRERIKKKINEIVERLVDLGMDPDSAVEKRLRSPFHHVLQQRVGDYRVWFEDIKEDEVLLISFIGHKEEAKERLL